MESCNMYDTEKWNNTQGLNSVNNCVIKSFQKQEQL